jgi:hypothetical protein
MPLPQGHDSSSRGDILRDEYTLRIDISIQDRSYSGNLRVSEEVTIGSAGFMEIAAILAEFHKLAGSLKAKREA